ncbi:MAG TPA: ATP-binding protein, partial [Burkholderiaceae bacterium]|nr:ATP-binding protein [Burkholderiaceae bacterium]
VRRTGALEATRAAAAREVPGARCAVEPLLAGLLRVMARVHAERGLRLHSEPIDTGCAFAGDAQDLQEMLGNLIDNACKWARQAVTLRARSVGGGSEARLQIQVDDDGPGIDPTLRERALTRGERLDEAVPGSGLGLAIVQELAQLYGGQLTLGPSPAGGLRAELDLPAALPIPT